MFQIFISTVIGYAFGCFSTAYLIGKINHIDIRKYGSGNAGTTNALRTLGLKAGVITFLGDLLKALVAIFLIRYLFQNVENNIQLYTLYAGLGVVLGHNFPFYLKFKGGKGIAATVGVMLAFDWRIALIACSLFIISVAITRYVSVGSLLLSLIFPLGIILFYHANLHMLVVSLVFTGLAFIKHQANIKRLREGTENKLGQKIKVN